VPWQRPLPAPWPGARGGVSLLGSRSHLGASLIEGLLVLLAYPRLDAAGDILRDRLLTQGAKVSLRMHVPKRLAIELMQRHAPSFQHQIRAPTASLN
jgi:hypothetical protein